MKKIKQLHFGLIMLMTFSMASQETLAGDPNAFLLGGDQGQNTGALTLIPIAIVDVEPDPNNTITFGGIGTDLEAGMPILSGALNGVNEELWLNFTHRAFNGEHRRIYVRSNLPIPNGMTMTLQVINSVTVQGNHSALHHATPIELTNVNQPVVHHHNESGYTGNGVGHGYHLRYTIENPNALTLPNGFEIIYTME